MVEMSRNGSGRHENAILRLALAAAVLATSACNSGGGGGGSDVEPPVFAGLDTATVVSPGTARLAWSAADDASLPVTYLVYRASAPASQDFSDASTPLASTESLTVDVSGLPGGAAPSYFVVRARDAAGNVDANTVEKSVQFAPNRLVPLGKFETANYATSDIAVHSSGNLVVMGGFFTQGGSNVRARVFDVTDRANPAILTTLYGDGRGTDVEIRGDVLWVSTEDDAGNGGAYAYDISNPAMISQTPIGKVTGPGVNQCHTIWLDGSFLYCASSDDGAIHILDVSNPATPVHLSSVGSNEGQIHDMYVSGTGTAGGLAVGCFLWGGWAFIDVSNPANPQLREEIGYLNAFTHNAWPTSGGTHLYTTDENERGYIRIWDIQNRGNVSQVGQYIGETNAIVHNVQIVGDYAYVAYYEAGVHVLDVSDPTDPVLVGFHDTYTGPTETNFAGAWGVAPFPPYLFVSDITSGLYTYRLDP